MQDEKGDFSMDPIFFTPAAGIFAMIFVGIFYWMVVKEDAGTPRMKEIASFIQEGANTFLRREFLTIAYFIVGLAILLLIVMPEWQIAFGFVFGALFSMSAVLIGMNAAVRANVRTTQAARTDPGKALTLAFRGGSIMGLGIVAHNLLGISILAIIFGIHPGTPERVSLLVGFGFGASLASLFAQLGGGIYTKAADVGADLVGKIEAGIPEDDPRNAAVIADLVGDNVGDCAGRGADLFESGSDNLVGTMIVGLAFLPVYGFNAILFPLLTRSIGAIGAVLGALAVRGTGRRNPITAINIGLFTTGAFSLITFYLLAQYLMHDIRLFWCLSLGLFAALAISLIVQYYTGMKKPVLEMAKATQSGAALNLLAGFSYGLESPALGIIVIALVNMAAYLIMGGGLLGFFGIAAATLGITEMKGIIMASDAFGPIADNAGGIAEMSGLGQEVRRAGDVLDAAGNITKAITKGYGMACALMTSVVILFAYLTEATRHQGMPFTRVEDIPIYLVDPRNIVAMMIGAVVPFLFSALAIRSVGRSAFKVVEEVRRQFREITGLMEGKAQPDYSRCVDIATKDSLREMILPTLVGVVAPLVVGFTLGVWALAAFLIAVKIVGAILATFMFNAGGAWDNAKKYIEDGHYGGKGTSAHAAAVVGDTFGDPLKDTAGPSLHILIKLENILSITCLPLFLMYGLKW
jgi:K(+)-stimulated pyrophosphate-energized sodium pump